MFNIKNVYVMLALFGLAVTAGDTNKRTSPDTGYNSGYTPQRQTVRHYSPVHSPQTHSNNTALQTVSPDHTPKHGTYFTNVASNDTYQNIVNILGLSRTRTHAKQPDTSSAVIAAPFFTNYHLVDDIVKNHEAGVKQTVIVGPAAVNCKGIQRLANTKNIDLRVNNKIHTKLCYRVYTDNTGAHHAHRVVGSANHTYRGYYHNHEQMTVLSDDYADDFDRDIQYLISHSRPYEQYCSGQHFQWSPQHKKTVATTPDRALLNSRHHDIHKRIADSIDKVPAGGSVVGSTFTLNDTEIIHSMKNAVERGVSVKLYIDHKTKVPSWVTSAIGSSIYRVAPPSGIHHVKSLVCDKGNDTYTTYIGTNNFTHEAQDHDFNQTVVSTSPQDAHTYMDLFQQSMRRFTVTSPHHQEGTSASHTGSTTGPQRNLSKVFDSLDIIDDTQ